MLLLQQKAERSPKNMDKPGEITLFQGDGVRRGFPRKRRRPVEKTAPRGSGVEDHLTAVLQIR